ncbi:hypothetical protein ANN_25944 [Periplaneta americana]|uniref:Uncharacterized protein n=1 Tax=Periplaneta americana TaxID=6978 RepID=A0ABQ8S4S4_PERAM|nr:hypothetical protein ANN_25944 [Periplaneta americana]
MVGLLYSTDMQYSISLTELGGARSTHEQLENCMSSPWRMHGFMRWVPNLSRLPPLTCRTCDRVSQFRPSVLKEDCPRMERNLTEGGTDGPAMRHIEIYSTNPRYGMSCMSQIPNAHRPNHMTPLTTGLYSRQNPYTIAASANSPKGLPVGPRRNSSPE